MGYSEIWTVKQTASDIHIRMDIKDDQLGDRVLDFEVPLDGKERRQTVIGTLANVRASWDGNTLFLEIERQARPDLLLHTRRRLQLAGGGNGLSHAPHNTHLLPSQSARKCSTGSSHSPNSPALRVRS
jgi:hypothetical protein